MSNLPSLCGLSVEDFKQQVIDLLPVGFAWPREENTIQSQFFESIAEELKRLHDRGCDLLEVESCPATVLELLTDWERVLGLPDPCTGVPETIEERRALVIAKLNELGGQNIDYFIKLARIFGFDITITECWPREYGSAEYGGEYLGPEWIFYWRVHSNIFNIRWREYGGASYGDAYRWWGNAILECILNRLKPAHTTIIFTYGVE